MPAHQTLPRPPVQLALLLAAHRRHGRSFDDAWERVMRTAKVRKNGETFDHSRLIWPPHEHAEWRAVLEATRSEWEAAYTGAPSRCGRALAAMAS